MTLTKKITNKLRSEGVRKTTAAAIHRIADRIITPFPHPPLPSAWSDYLNWLTFAVPGMLIRTNVDAFSHALQHLPPGGAPMLEIGTFCGLSASILSYLRVKHSVPNRFFTCDRWCFEGRALGSTIGDHKFVTHDQYRPFVMESYLRNARMFCQPDLPYTIEADSDDFFKRWRANENATDVFGRDVKLGGALSFCNIDGDHAYAWAKRDFENTDRHLLPGGFIFFDDSGDGSGWEVCQVVAEVLKSGRYELIAKNPNYLVQKRR